MPIRFALPADIPALVELGARMHALTRFKTQEYDRQKVAQTLADLVSSTKNKYVLFVAESAKGQVAGTLVGVLEQQIFSDALVASVMHFDVLPEFRMGGYGLRLIKAFEQWAKNRKVIELQFGVNSGVDMDRIGKFAVRLGYQKVGENYVK